MNLRRLQLDTKIIDQLSNKYFDPLYSQLYRPLHSQFADQIQDKCWRHFQTCLNQDEYIRQNET